MFSENIKARLNISELVLVSASNLWFGIRNIMHIVSRIFMSENIRLITHGTSCVGYLNMRYAIWDIYWYQSIFKILMINVCVLFPVFFVLVIIDLNWLCLCAYFKSMLCILSMICRQGHGYHVRTQIERVVFQYGQGCFQKSKYEDMAMYVYSIR